MSIFEDLPCDFPAGHKELIMLELTIGRICVTVVICSEARS